MRWSGFQACPFFRGASFGQFCAHAGLGWSGRLFGLVDGWGEGGQLAFPLAVAGQVRFGAMSEQFWGRRGQWGIRAGRRGGVWWLVGERPWFFSFRPSTRYRSFFGDGGLTRSGACGGAYAWVRGWSGIKRSGSVAGRRVGHGDEGVAGGAHDFLPYGGDVEHEGFPAERAGYFTIDHKAGGVAEMLLLRWAG